MHFWESVVVAKKDSSGTDIFGYDLAAPEYLSLMYVCPKSILNPPNILQSCYRILSTMIAIRYATGPGHKGENWNLLEEPKLGDKDFRFTGCSHSQ